MKTVFQRLHRITQVGQNLSGHTCCRSARRRFRRREPFDILHYENSGPMNGNYLEVLAIEAMAMIRKETSFAFAAYPLRLCSVAESTDPKKTGSAHQRIGLTRRPSDEYKIAASADDALYPVVNFHPSFVVSKLDLQHTGIRFGP